MNVCSQAAEALTAASWQTLSPSPTEFREVPHILRLLGSLLAPSSRVLAFIARRGRVQVTSMAVTTIEQAPVPSMKAEAFPPPPPVVTTPCDPWPRPYYLEDGLRKVLPYHYTYNTYCKERWRGKEILHIFKTEFRDRPESYYVRSLLSDLEYMLTLSRKMP